MNKYWIATSETNKELWNEQYNKHGYCYVNRFKENPKSNYPIYFQKSIDLYNKYNFSNLFKEFYNGIFPGEQKLNKTYLMSKLNEKFGNNTYALTCLKFNEKYYFNEIRFKFDLNFSLTKEGLIKDDCPDEFYVEFMENEGPQQQAIGFNESYDIYFFTVLWLGTTCKVKGEQCFNNIKDVPKNIFTIHGLWPNYKNGTLADWCNGKNDIEIDIKDNSLLNYMNTYYRSGYHTNKYFWGHEYNKHGYCFNQRNNIDVNDYEKYFEKVKELYIKYNLSDIFINMFNHTLAPGDKTVNRTELEIYLNKTGISKDTYQIVCQNVTDNLGKISPNLLEIRIRFDLDFNLLKNGSDPSEFDCPTLFNVLFL
jgi:ribonuclease I